MSSLFPNWLKHLCPARRAQTWRCHLVAFHQEQAFKELDFCLLLFFAQIWKVIVVHLFPSVWVMQTAVIFTSFNANHGCLVQSCNIKCRSSYNGIVKFVVYTLGQQQEILLLYTAEYLWHDFNNHQAENYCLLFSSVELPLLIIMISLETARVWC